MADSWGKYMYLIKCRYGYFLVFILIFMIIPLAHSSDSASITKPVITSGSEISEGESITVSSTLNGQVYLKDKYNLFNINKKEYILDLSFEIELYEYNYGLLDKKIGSNPIPRKVKLSQLGDVTVDLIDVPVGTVTSDRKIYVKIKAICNPEGDLTFNQGQETEWSKSDTISLKVIEKPMPTVSFKFEPESETINLGESIIISAECENLGGKASGYSAISISFPNLDSEGDENQVSLYGHNFYSPKYFTSIIPKGGTIWKLMDESTSRMEKSKANYVSVEGGTSDKITWETKEKHYLSVKVTPKKIGEFNIFIRATLPGLAKQKMFTDPSSSSYDMDQQNFMVYRKTIIVKQPSELEVIPSNYYIDFGNIDLGEAYSKKMRVKNSGGETLNWEIKNKETLTGGIKEGINWASFEPSSGTLEKGSFSDIIVKLDTSNSEIKPGHKYDAAFLLSSNGGESNHQIHFYVNKPQLKLDNLNINFGEINQGTSVSRTFTISNNGEGILKWSIDKGELPEWIRLDKYSGEARAGNQLETISVTLDTQGLAPETAYENIIQVNSNGGLDDLIINAKVLLPPVLCISPEPMVLDFGKIAQRRTETRTIELSNCGGSTLSWSVTSYSSSWLIVDPISGSASTESKQVAVTVNTENMEPNTYTGYIKFDSNAGSKTCLVNIEVTNPEQIIVCSEGCNYKTIQEAIDAAIPGDVIEVRSGTYHETVNVNKQLSLLGVDTGDGNPVIDANGNGNPVTISADGTKLENFRVIGSAGENPAAIHITSNSNILSGNKIDHNQGRGIYIENANDNIIKLNEIRDNLAEGIRLIGAEGNTIQNNLISRNKKVGIYMLNSNNNKIFNNRLLDNILYNAYDDGSNNWDSGSMGNYYSDFECPEKNVDGICNSGHTISGGSCIDRFPLTQEELSGITGLMEISPEVSYTNEQMENNEGKSNIKSNSEITTPVEASGKIINVHWPTNVTHDITEPIPVEVSLENTGSEACSYWMTYSVQDTTGKWWDAPPKQTVATQPGENESIELLWTPPEDAPEGAYTAKVALWEGQNSDTGLMEGEVANRTKESAFQLNPKQPTGVPQSKSLLKWNTTFREEFYDDFFSIQQTNDNGYILVGRTAYDSDRKKDDYHAYMNRFSTYLMKIDSQGNELWNKTFRRSHESRGNFVQQTSDGGYVIAGATWDDDPKANSALLIKTDSKGNELWNKTYWQTPGSDEIHGSDDSSANSVQQTNDGGYIIGGVAGVELGSGFLIKTDTQGNEIWNRTIVNCDEIRSVLLTNDGGYVIAGNYEIYTYTRGFFHAFLLSKFDTNGNELWNKTLGPISHKNAEVCSAQQTSDGGYIVAGNSGYNSFTEICIVKTDTNGNELWNKTLIDKESMLGESMLESMLVQETFEGGYILFGESKYDMDYLLIKFDVNGNELWNKTISRSNHSEDILRSGLQTNDEGYILVGTTSRYNIWLVKTDTNGNT